jgi:tetratricopeptide (TPR) repeat protein
MSRADREAMEWVQQAFDYTTQTERDSMQRAIRYAANARKNDAWFIFASGFWNQTFGFLKEAKVHPLSCAHRPSCSADAIPAQAEYSRALRIDPTCADALFELGAIYLMEFQTEKAHELASRIWF